MNVLVVDSLGFAPHSLSTQGWLENGKDGAENTTICPPSSVTARSLSKLSAPPTPSHLQLNPKLVLVLV